MFRSLFLSTICAGALGASVIIGDLGSAQAGFTSGRSFTGQTFTVPAQTNILTTWQFNLAGWKPFNGFTNSITMGIYDWTGDLSGGLVPHYAVSIQWPTTTGVVSLTGLNVALVSGQTYVMVYRTGDYGASALGFYGSDRYSGGQLLLGLDMGQLGTDAPSWAGFDTDFAATFVDPAPAAVSDAPEPSFIPVLIGIAAIAAARARNRRPSGPARRG